ncbi:MAG: hypothetical protein R2698_10615 [Microthrixaceae bacterium]
MLGDLGVRITKSVWMFDPPVPFVGGTSCAEPDYLEWVRSLQEAGHEIGWHNTADGSSHRARTIEALDRFEEVFGHAPRVGADHAGNREALYWGPRRLSGPLGSLYDRAGRFMRSERPDFSGDDPTSEYYWADVCRDRITYWRNFCFRTLDLSGVGPVVYHDPARPMVNYWFTSTDASNPQRLFRHFEPASLDRLEQGGGVSILYTHLGVRLFDGGRLVPRFRDAWERLMERSVWVAPVSEVLDHIRSQYDETVISTTERSTIELRWVADRLVDGTLLRVRR